MKQAVAGLLLVLFIGVTAIVFAQTQTASPSSSVDEKDIQTFKEKVANKVAENQKLNNKAVSGFVTATSAGSIQIKNENGVVIDIKLDEPVTKYYQIVGNQTKEIKLSDIKKGTFVIVTGIATDTGMTANSIYIDEMFLVKSGKIAEIDKQNFILKVISSEKETYSLEIESTTRQQIINVKTLTEEGTGFSKIKEGDIIHFVVKKTGQEKNNTYTAIKILIIPQEYFLK